MTLGVASRQGDLLDDITRFCDEKLDEHSIYAFLHRERDRLFPDEAFADLFESKGRRSVPPSVVAVVMVLQRLEGLSDREAVERYCFDTRWRYAAGVGGYDSEGWTNFSHTVLVDMRERLRTSQEPNRIFDVTRDAAKEAGLVGKKRVLDSTPLYDAVATMDTVTLIRSAIRGLLKVAEGDLGAELRGALRSGDDYATSDKPQIDWDDAAARDALIDSRAKDAYAILLVLEGKELGPVLSEAASLLATVVGQDIEERADGVFAIVRGVARDRIISTVDPEARHGHKTQARGFDGYKGHAAVDPDSEIITETVVTPGNAGDATVAEDLIADLTADPEPEDSAHADLHTNEESSDKEEPEEDRPVVYGDNAYGTGPFQERLEEAGIDSRCKTQDPNVPGDLFTKDRFDVNVGADTVTCPNGVTVKIKRHRRGGGMAYFKEACSDCPLRDQCTTSEAGRTISINVHEEALARARARQRDPAWRADYRATRPKVERKLAHLMRRRHGGRRARVRGTLRVDADFRLLAAAANLARLGVLGVRWTATGWAVTGG
jgi:IS5 family transposase